MTTSFTNTPYLSSNHSSFIAAKALQADKVVLVSTDTVWSITCAVHSYEAVARLEMMGRKDLTPEILFSSVHQVKDFIPRLHPRLENLLMVHQRPLTLLIDNPDQFPGGGAYGQNKIAIRVVQNEYTRQLIDQVDAPLYSIPAHTAEGAIAGHFGQISSDVLAYVDFVDKYRQIDTTPNTLSVMATMNENEELDFLRS